MESSPQLPIFIICSILITRVWGFILSARSCSNVFLILRLIIFRIGINWFKEILLILKRRFRRLMGREMGRLLKFISLCIGWKFLIVVNMALMWMFNSLLQKEFILSRNRFYNLWNILSSQQLHNIVKVINWWRHMRKKEHSLDTLKSKQRTKNLYQLMLNLNSWNNSIQK